MFDNCCKTKGAFHVQQKWKKQNCPFQQVQLKVQNPSFQTLHVSSTDAKLISKKSCPKEVTFHGLIGFHSLESLSLILVTSRGEVPFDKISLLWRLFLLSRRLALYYDSEILMEIESLLWQGFASWLTRKLQELERTFAKDRSFKDAASFGFGFDGKANEDGRPRNAQGQTIARGPSWGKGVLGEGTLAELIFSKYMTIFENMNIL